jgi:hypothetical protein
MGQVVAISGVAVPFPAGPELTVRADGLNNPRGIFVDASGDVFFAQSGTAGDDCQEWPGNAAGDTTEVCFGNTGSIEMLTEDGATAAVSSISSMLDIRGDVLGVHDVAVGADGLLHAIVGLGGVPEYRAEFPVAAGDLGWLVSASVGTNTFLDEDIGAYETAANPDGGLLDSNPFSLVSDGADGWVISDSGMNALVHVDAEGVSTLAVFPERLVVAPPEAGLPDGASVPMQSVPTGVVRGPDGAFYVGELTGFPFIQGGARVWRVSAAGAQQVFAEGFTNIVDLAFDSAGNLYVLQLAKDGLLSGDISSSVVRVMANGDHMEVASAGLSFATGLAIGPDDTFYVSNFGVMPDMGQVVSFTLD